MEQRFFFFFPAGALKGELLPSDVLTINEMGCIKINHCAALALGRSVSARLQEAGGCWHKRNRVLLGLGALPMPSPHLQEAHL